MKTVIEMAKEAGFEVNYYKSLESEEVVSFDPIITFYLERFATIVRDDERKTNGDKSSPVEDAVI